MKRYTRKILQLWAIRQVAELDGRLTFDQVRLFKGIDRPFATESMQGQRPSFATKAIVRDEQSNIKDLCNLLTEFGLLTKSPVPILLPEQEHFVPGTFVTRGIDPWRNIFDSRPPEREFGQQLEK
jgi:hypothetical protein